MPLEVMLRKCGKKQTSALRQSKLARLQKIKASSRKEYTKEVNVNQAIPAPQGSKRACPLYFAARAMSSFFGKWSSRKNIGMAFRKAPTPSPAARTGTKKAPKGFFPYGIRTLPRGTGCQIVVHKTGSCGRGASAQVNKKRVHRKFGRRIIIAKTKRTTFQNETYNFYVFSHSQNKGV